MCSFLAQPLLIAVSSLQSRNLVATCYIAYALHPPTLPLTVLYFLATLMLDVGSFILLLGLAVR